MRARCVRDRVREHEYVVYMPVDATLIRGKRTVRIQLVSAGHSAGGCSARLRDTGPEGTKGRARRQERARRYRRRGTGIAVPP